MASCEYDTVTIRQKTSNNSGYLVIKKFIISQDYKKTLTIKGGIATPENPFRKLAQSYKILMSSDLTI